MYNPAYPNPAMMQKPPSAGTAETLILVALILQIIFTLIFLAATAVLGAVFFLFGGFIVAGIIILIGLFFIYAGWQWSYERVKSGNYNDRGWTLILGILGIIFGGVIVGILYIIAYVKIGDAQNEQNQMRGGMMGAAPGYAPGYGGQYPGYPQAQTSPYRPAGGYPAAPGYAVPQAGAPATPSQGAPAQPTVAMPASVAPTAPAAPACPRCHNPATWIPQYNRYYCYNCQQYV
jgi:hypothetical protein